VCCVGLHPVPCPRLPIATGSLERDEPPRRSTSGAANSLQLYQDGPWHIYEPAENPQTSCIRSSPVRRADGSGVSA
jgi:hypothetical protein